MYNIRHKPSLILTILASTALVLLTFFVLLSNPKSSSSRAAEKMMTPHIHVHKNIQIAQSHCEGILHPELCVSTLSSFPNLHRKSIAEIISSTVKIAVGKVRASAHNCSDLRRHVPKLEPIEKRALQDYVELLGETIAELRTALTDLSPKKSASKHYNDIQTLLSAAMTNEDTCLDGLFYSTKNNLTRYVEDNLHTIAHHVSNSLAMLNKIKRTSVSSSEEVFPEYGAMKNGFPKWLKRRERALLQVPVNETSQMHLN